ncbi:hypothetical protein CEV34_4998 [Brucella pseudogrignonensis]|uniref:Uncharacterized protein n=1 Tax=Brucella pseudogrignonensis TaxID=419475 RepID=A0A256G2R9_9HYPH|nr:hypothetical protein CEV34_4998 [Brucella pseudogrignonensis]
MPVFRPEMTVKEHGSHHLSGHKNAFQVLSPTNKICVRTW